MSWQCKFLFFPKWSHFLVISFRLISSFLFTFQASKQERKKNFKFVFLTIHLFRGPQNREGKIESFSSPSIQNMRIFMQQHHEIEIFSTSFIKILRNSSLDHDVTGSENIFQLFRYCSTFEGRESNNIIEIKILLSFISKHIHATDFRHGGNERKREWDEVKNVNHFRTSIKILFRDSCC